MTEDERRAETRGMILLATALVSSVLALVFAQAQWLPMAFVVIAMFGFSQSTFRTTSGTLTQTLVPDALRGRVTSLQRYGQGFVVGTSLLMGWLAGVTSVTTALSVAGLIALSLSALFALTVRRVREQS